MENLKEIQVNFLKRQNELRNMIYCSDTFDVSEISMIAGVDLAYWKNGDDEYAVCCIVIIDADTHKIIENKHFSGKIEVPYVPGFLAFRELPLVLETVKLLENQPHIPDQIYKKIKIVSD